MRDMARKRAKPQKQQCECHTEVREVEGDRGGHEGMEKPRQQEQQCEGHTGVKGGREGQKVAQNTERQRQQEDRGC